MSAPKRRRMTLTAVVAAMLAALVSMSVPAAANPIATGAAAGGPGPLQPVQTMPVNICQNSSLPKDYGTNFPTPSDPYGFGFANQTAIGWQGNYYAPFEYLSGSYFARGVPLTYQPGGAGTTYCGAMYSFSVYTYGLAAGQAPAAGSVQWTEADGYLPAMTTSFTRNDVAISITDFANEQTIGGTPVELVYTRVQVTNHGKAAVTVPAGQSGPNLVALDSASDTVNPGRTVDHDFVAAVDTFSTTTALPTVAAITPSKGHSGALSYDAAYKHMAQYWNQLLSATPQLSLPNVALPNTNSLKNPGTSIDNAYKAAFIYTRIVQAGEAPYSGANNYAYLLNHDAPGILMNSFEEGDFTDAQSLLLNARISEASNFNEQGANWYWDGPWRTPVAWADYLQGTNDTAFVSTYFHDDASSPSPWGPSLYTLMHTDYLAQLSTTTGYLKASDDNDSEGTWLFDDETALAGLSAYKYIATRIGNTTEAQWANGAYNSLLSAVNTALAANESANGFDYLPCEVNKPTSADRCNAANDANWAGSNLWGQNVWDILLEGGSLDGALGDPTQTDNLYETGFAKLDGTGVPYPSFGAYPGYSVALNTAYTQGALYGNAYRDLPITSYAWQIATTTGGPNAWWEANGTAPDPNNPWAGSHAAPQFGAVPYAWPMAGQTQTLLQSLVAPGLESSTNANGSYSYQTALYIGRGVPDEWITSGQTIAENNITASYNENSGKRATYGVSINTTTVHGDKVVHVSLRGAVPNGDDQVQLPIFADAGVQSVSGGSYDATSHTVTMHGRTASITLGHSGKPTVAVQTASTAPGSHSQPTLLSGQQTTATATVTNTGATTLTDVKIGLQAPSGWTVTPAAPAAATATAAANEIKPGKSETVTFDVTPPATAGSGYGLVATATYDAPDKASGTASGEQWVIAQKPLPLPPGTTDLALTATASASYTSPWTSIAAINNGVYPIQSSDDSDLTPYWGDWPQTGSHWVELDWTAPVTTDGTEVYWADDGGGLLTPSTWVVQYWDGTAWDDVTGQSGQPVALDTFNQITFDPVTASRFRILMQSTGTASVGVIQWIVPSVPAS